MSSLLSQLKVSLTSLSFLPTGAADPKELTVARNTLEIGAKFAVAEGDIPMFERYMAQLQTYYYDYTSLAESDFKWVHDRMFISNLFNSPLFSGVSCWG